MTIDFNQKPYYDDFDETKQFYRLLFRPGNAVQARELTQLQTILQNQVSRFGKHIFKEGSMVLGGQLTYEDRNVFYVKINDEDVDGNTVDVNNFLNKFIVDENDVLGIRAFVVAVDDGALDDQKTLIVKYLSKNKFNNSTNFRDENNEYKATSTSSSATGSTAIISINDGVFFAKGIFAKVNPQTLILDKFSNTPSYRVGLQVDESIVTETSDTSLLDPALEASNYQAPGATRYKLDLVLSKRALSNTDDVDFIDLMRLENGAIKQQIIYPQYSALEDTLARRTYDESGDYTVRPFSIHFTSDRVSNNGFGFSNTYNVVVGPGKAYVKGYEFETISPTTIVSDRAVDYANITSEALTFNYQNYVDVTNLVGPVYLDSFIALNVHCVNVATLNTSSQALFNATDIGYVRIRALDYQYGANTTSLTNAVWRAYLFDTNITSKVDLATGGSANTIILPSNYAVQNNAYVGVKIRVVGQGTPKTASSFSNSQIVVSSATGITVGQSIIGPGIIKETTVVGVNGTTISLSANTNTTTISNTFAFFNESDYQNDLKVISSYDGIAKIATVSTDWDFGTPNTATLFSLEYEFKDAESFVIANTVSGNVTTQMNISRDNKYSSLTDQYEGAFISESNYNSVILPFSKKVIVPNSITNTEYFGRVMYDVTFTSNVVTFFTDASVANVKTFVNGSIAASDAIDNFFVVITNNNGVGSVANNTVVNFLDGNNTITVTNSNEVTLTVKDAHNATAKVYVKTDIESPESTSSIHKTKSLKQANTSLLVGTGVDEIVTGNIRLHVNQTGQPGIQLNISSQYLEYLSDPKLYQLLYVSDVISLSGVYDFGANTISQANLSYALNITDNYTLDDGQRDSTYEHASITLKPGRQGPTGNVVIFADYYEHTGKGYFSVTSYPDYEKIPIFSSATSGTYYNLRDVLDFRPRRKTGLSGFNGEYDEVYFGISGTSFDADYSYYLPRIDKLILTKNKKLEIVRGISSLTPIPPIDREDSMTLYTIILPAYDIDLIRARMVDHRRYTMRDIGEIEQRVQNLEYFTSLNFLEKNALNEEIIDDSTGLVRPKTGMVVDPFTGHNISDVTNEDYNAAIDIDKREVRPAVDTENFRVQIKTDSSVNYSSNIGFFAMIDYTEVPVITQNAASSYVGINPLGVKNVTLHSPNTPINNDYPEKEDTTDVIDNSDGKNDSWEHCRKEWLRLKKNGQLKRFRKKHWRCYNREWNWWKRRIEKKKTDKEEHKKTYKVDKEIQKFGEQGLDYDKNFAPVVDKSVQDLAKKGKDKPIDINTTNREKQRRSDEFNEAKEKLYKSRKTRISTRKNKE